MRHDTCGESVAPYVRGELSCFSRIILPATATGLSLAVDFYGASVGLRAGFVVRDRERRFSSGTTVSR